MASKKKTTKAKSKSGKSKSAAKKTAASKKPKASPSKAKSGSAKAGAAKKPASKQPASKKAASSKTGSKGKAKTAKKSSKKAAVKTTKKVAAKAAKTSKKTSKKTSSKTAKTSAAKKPASKKAASSKSKTAKKGPATKTVRVSTVSVVKTAVKKVKAKKEKAKKEKAKKEAAAAEAAKTKVDAKTGLKPARLRSQPVEVQEIDQRVDRERQTRLKPFTPRSYGSAPKKPKPKDIVDLLTKHMGKAPSLSEKQMPGTVIELGIFCIFALGGNSAKASLDSTNRLTKRFPVWNEFRVSEAYEFLEVLDGIKLAEAYDHCEQVLEFVNEVYKDQNEVDLEFLKEMSAEDRLVALNRYRSLGPALSHYIALALQGFEGVLFHYSWARPIQRVGIVERSGSPKKLSASIAKNFKGQDLVSMQVDLIDLGEDICLPKAPNCRNCYLVLHCKSRKI